MRDRHIVVTTVLRTNHPQLQQQRRRSLPLKGPPDVSSSILDRLFLHLSRSINDFVREIGGRKRFRGDLEDAFGRKVFKERQGRKEGTEVERQCGSRVLFL